MRFLHDPTLDGGAGEGSSGVGNYFDTSGNYVDVGKSTDWDPLPGLGGAGYSPLGTPEGAPEGYDIFNDTFFDQPTTAQGAYGSGVLFGGGAEAVSNPPRVAAPTLDLMGIAADLDTRNTQIRSEYPGLPGNPYQMNISTGGVDVNAGMLTSAGVPYARQLTDYSTMSAQGPVTYSPTNTDTGSTLGPAAAGTKDEKWYNQQWLEYALGGAAIAFSFFQYNQTKDLEMKMYKDSVARRDKELADEKNFAREMASFNANAQIDQIRQQQSAGGAGVTRSSGVDFR